MAIAAATPTFAIAATPEVGPRSAPAWVWGADPARDSGRADRAGGGKRSDGVSGRAARGEGSAAWPRTFDMITPQAGQIRAAASTALPHFGQAPMPGGV